MQSIIDTLTNCNYPFAEDSYQMWSLSSGVQATPDVQSDLLCAYEKGLKSFIEFVSSRLVAGTKGFFEPLPKLKLQTFASMSKAKRVSTKRGQVQLRADAALFARLAVLAQQRSMNMVEACPTHWDHFLSH